MASRSLRRETHPPSSPEREAAEYIAQMAGELAHIAEFAQLDMLSYFLKMAQMEATETYWRLKDKTNSH
jgi:hypothetical protein